MAGSDIVFYGTTGPAGSADGDSQPDTTQWLGRFRASQRLDEIQSTLTAAQTDRSRHVFVDSARIGDGANAHALKWVAIQTGAAALSAARVVAFDHSTGAFTLDRRLSANAGIGDVYRVFAPNNVWPDVAAAGALAGEDRYRCIVVRNGHGSITSANTKQVILAPLSSGLDFARFHQENFSGAGAPFLQRSNDQTDLFNVVGARDPLGGPDQFSGASGWVAPYTEASAHTEIKGANTWLLNANCAIWLRRRIEANSRPRRSVAVQVIFVSDLTGSDPDPLTSSAILAYDVLGDSLSATLTPDRYAHILSGARVNGVALTGAAPLEDRPARWRVRPGDPGTISTDDDPSADYDTTDAAGRVAATYRGPDAPTCEGDQATVQLLLGDGEEIANPIARANLVGDVAMAFAGFANLTLPAEERSYLDDAASGFWPGF